MNPTVFGNPGYRRVAIRKHSKCYFLVSLWAYILIFTVNFIYYLFYGRRDTKPTLAANLTECCILNMTPSIFRSPVYFLGYLGNIQIITFWVFFLVYRLSTTVFFFYLFIRTSSEATFSNGPFHTDVQVLDDQLELIYVFLSWEIQK